MPEDFVVARNPEADSSLPFLLRFPVEPQPVIVKARESWPRTAKVYCHRAEAWPDEPDIVERVPVRSCRRRGAAIDLVLDRGRENRSQLILTNARGRQMIFWQSARTAKKARPAVSVPAARASGLADLEIVVDGHERYPYSFADRPVTVVRGGLPAGDYAVVEGGRLLATVERKALDDLVSSLTTGKLQFQLSDLAAVAHAAVVVEERYSEIFKLRHVRPSVVADGIAECQVRWPSVPIVFCDSRKLAQEWTYRFLAAATVHARERRVADLGFGALVTAGPLPAVEPSHAVVRSWAQAQGLRVSDRGRVSATLRAAYAEAQAADDPEGGVS